MVAAPATAAEDREVKQDFRLDLANKVMGASRRLSACQFAVAVESPESDDTPTSCCAPVTHILNSLQRFLYRANDIGGVDRVALQRDIVDVIDKEGETSA